MENFTNIFSPPLGKGGMIEETTMLNSFSCRNFRNIEAEDLRFKRINLLVGPNNSGKSNFIKALTFFSEMLKGANDGGLNSSFLNVVSRNGWDHMRNSSISSSEPIELLWNIDIGDMPVKYGFKFVVGDSVNSCDIVSETLNATKPSSPYYDKAFNYFQCHEPYEGSGFFSTATKKGGTNQRIGFHIDSKETIVIQFKDILLQDKKVYNSDYVRKNIADLLYSIQNFFSGFNVFAGSQFNTSEIRKPADVKNIDLVLNKSAANFANIFNNYKIKDLRWKNEFIHYMQQLIPALSDMDSAVLYDKLVLKLICGDSQYDLSDVSEGTIKGLVLNTIINMYKEQECSLLAIDEPEMNLHPAWQKVVGNWIQLSSRFSQCFISTHSPDFLDAFTEGFKSGDVAVFVFGTDATHCSIKMITYDEISEELGDWELGDLYRTNDPALGGWPW